MVSVSERRGTRFQVGVEREKGQRGSEKKGGTVEREGESREGIVSPVEIRE